MHKILPELHPLAGRAKVHWYDNMKYSAIRTFLILGTTCLAMNTFAQNSSRVEEEAQLDSERKARVEEAVRAREEEARVIEQNPDLYSNPEQKKLVEVEPNNILPADLTNVSALIPYRVRRQSTGVDVGIGFSTYMPVNYESNYISGTLADFEGLYGSADFPMIELHFNYKKNLSFGSIGADLGLGYYKNAETTDAGDKLTLFIQTFRLGGKFILDNLSYEPKVAPYVALGGYTVVYKEDNEVTSTNGNTQVALYYSAGVMFQLNWIDPGAAVEAYAESGIENTFLFAQVRQFQASAAENDPDFSTDPIFDAGMSLEF